MTTTVAAQDAVVIGRLLNPPVTLQLQLPQPGSTVVVESMNARRGVEDRVVMRCEHTCAAALPPGRYQLTLHQPDSTDVDTQTIRLNQPLSYRALEPDQTLRLLGVTSIVVGGLLVVPSVVGLFVVALNSLCEGGSDCGVSPNIAAYALIGLSTGLVLAAVGLILFLSNRRAFARSPLSAPSNVHLGVSTSSSGAGGQLSVAF